MNTTTTERLEQELREARARVAELATRNRQLENDRETIWKALTGEPAAPEPGKLIGREIKVCGLTEEQFHQLGEAIGDPLGRYKAYGARHGVYLNDEQHDLAAAIRFARAHGLTYEQTIATMHGCAG